jgi:hypothetical protein
LNHISGHLRPALPQAPLSRDIEQAVRRACRRRQLETVINFLHATGAGESFVTLGAGVGEMPLVAYLRADLLMREAEVAAFGRAVCLLVRLEHLEARLLGRGGAGRSAYVPFPEPYLGMLHINESRTRLDIALA